MSGYQLAQLNIAKMKAPLESPVMADFVANLGRINALAEQSEGFIWRLKDDTGSATAIRPFGDEVIVNLSAWKDIATLKNYAFISAHVEIMRRRREWFEHMSEPSSVLWWISGNQFPTLVDARNRLEHLQKFGATPYSFTFKDSFAPPQ